MPSSEAMRHRKKKKKRRRLSYKRVVLYSSVCLVLLATMARTISTIVGLMFTSSNSTDPDDNEIVFSLPPLRYEGTLVDAVIGLNSKSPNNNASSFDEYDAFCLPWDIDMDIWWTQRAARYELHSMNTRRQCFVKIIDERKLDLYRRLVRIQFPSVSSSSGTALVQSKLMTGSGWGVDISHVVDGLQWALSSETTTRIVAPVPWQYASGVHGSSRRTCPAEDLSCYFLPLTNSSDGDAQDRHLEESRSAIRYRIPWRGFYRNDGDWTVPWLLEFATRGQTWLRKRVVDATTPVGLPRDEHCAVLHVRRADVVLHGKFSRRYHSIGEYLRVVPDDYTNILLLTDDANAIVEAKTQQSGKYKWFYLDRPRHRGAEGGWEHQIPSNDPAYEVVMLFAAFELAKQCDLLVHSKSNLADYIYAIMMLNNTEIRRFDLDAGKPHNKVHHSANADSVQISTQFG
jgi:hypothetical protein